jgi:hypothetical protein
MPGSVEVVNVLDSPLVEERPDVAAGSIAKVVAPGA